MLFFKNTFGWEFKQFGNEPYWLAISGDEKSPGINGAVMKKIAPGQPVINTITVDDIDKALKSIEQNGGKVVKPKWKIPGAGWLAFFADPDGNMHGVMQLEIG
jgi:hypothetical protein